MPKKRRTIVHGVAIGEQQQLVELLVQSRARLMDCGDDCAPTGGQLAE